MRVLRRNDPTKLSEFSLICESRRRLRRRSCGKVALGIRVCGCRFTGTGIFLATSLLSWLNTSVILSRGKVEYPNVQELFDLRRIWELKTTGRPLFWKNCCFEFSIFSSTSSLEAIYSPKNPSVRD